MADLAGRDVFLRNTDVDGKSYVSQHRCWDAEIFVMARQTEASALALEPVAKGKPPGKNKVTRITEDQFHKERQQ